MRVASSIEHGDEDAQRLEDLLSRSPLSRRYVPDLLAGKGEEAEGEDEAVIQASASADVSASASPFTFISFFLIIWRLSGPTKSTSSLPVR
jgi:hypothetical protein